MGNTGEEADASSLKMEKKLKKSKNKTNDLLDVGDGDGNIHVETDGDEDQHDKVNLVIDGDLQKKDKKKKKRKRDSSEKSQIIENDLLDVGVGNSHVEADGDEDRHDKGNLVIDDYLQKKDKKKKKRKRDSSEKSQIIENGLLDVGVGNSHVEADGDEGQLDKGNLVIDGDLQKKDKKKKRRKRDSSEKSQIIENDLLKFGVGNSHVAADGDEDRHDKGNLVIDGDLQKKDKKKRKRKRDSSEKEQIKENERDRNSGPDVEKDCDPKPEKKKKKKIDCQNSDTEMNGIVTQDTEDKSVEKQKVKGSKVKRKSTESVENNTGEPKAKSKSKKVSFSGQVEVFPMSDTEPKKQKTKGDGLVRGKRFTPEEDEIVKQAVLNYITAHDLGDEGLKMVLNCNSHPGMKKCWQEIGLCIPYRPYTAVYYRAHILFERAETRSWTTEEIKLLKEFHEKHGNSWKKLADELGKHRFHVKDTWRRIKLENLKGGKWSQDEYQNLYDLVNLDLQMKINGQEKKSKHGMLRDNIPWTAISERLSTRSDATCCTKWYNQLTSSLVAEKKWCDADDYRMIGALYEIDAASIEDVDWDNVLDHRPGDICRKRWNQMVKHIGDYGSKPFGEQVDILAKRYCPDLAETREDWDNKPLVP